MPLREDGVISGTSESLSVSRIVAESPPLKPPVRSAPASAPVR